MKPGTIAYKTVNFRKTHGIFLVILIFILSGCGLYSSYRTISNSDWERFSSSIPGTPRLEYQHAVPILHLYGTPEEMGRQYGTILQNHLQLIVQTAEKFFTKKRIKKFISIAEGYRESLPDETMEFISGMAETSGINHKYLMAINVVPKISCSTLAVWDSATIDQNLIMGRNADYKLRKINNFLGIIVVKHPAEGLATVSSSFLGLAGTFTGINEKGVCYGNMLAYNGYEIKNHKDGLPIQVLMQLSAERSSSAREMANDLAASNHVIPVNVMCADRHDAVLIELGQNNFAFRESNNGILAGSNNFYASGMFKKSRSDKQFNALILNAENHYGDFTLKKMKDAMHAASFKNKTLQCVIFEPEKMLIHVSMNKVPASKGPFIEFDVNELLKK